MGQRGTTPANSAREIIGLIIQRSTIELFEAYGVAVAPVASDAKSPSIPPGHMVGSVLLTSGTRRGTLMLACSTATLARMKPNVDDRRGLQDWLRELTNQLAGRIKNRFGRHRVPLHVGLPSATEGASGESSLENQKDVGVYVFRTLKDDVYVILGGGLDSIKLELQGGPNSVEEGDIIIF